MKMAGRILLLTAVVSLAWISGETQAIILHPRGEPGEEWKERPAEAFSGRWGKNASCVAISPWHVITTRHQGGGEGTTKVYIGEKEYDILKIWTHPTADMKVARISGKLENFARIYLEDNEIGKGAVIAGFGDGRGETLSAGDVVYGYSWDSSANTKLRLGTNIIEAAGNTPEGAPLPSEVLVIRFDDPRSTPYECAVADHDSGGGWFIYHEKHWKVAALSRGVERIGESWFRDSQRPGVFADPDFCHGIRLSKYAEWINQTISQDIAMMGIDEGREEQESGSGSGLREMTPGASSRAVDLKSLAQEWLSGTGGD